MKKLIEWIVVFYLIYNSNFERCSLDTSCQSAFVCEPLKCSQLHVLALTSRLFPVEFLTNQQHKNGTNL